MAIAFLMHILICFEKGYFYVNLKNILNWLIKIKKTEAILCFWSDFNVD